ncbi:MAG: hypothetical protein HUJ52_01775 [Malacoplasma sp.]|nr:hypothetical protein [Malacoplasma sp.]
MKILLLLCNSNFFINDFLQKVTFPDYLYSERTLMNLKLKQINIKTKNMNYLEVIDWIKGKSIDFEHEVIYANYFFQSRNEDEDDLVSKVKTCVKAIIDFHKEKKNEH